MGQVASIRARRDAQAFVKVARFPKLLVPGAGIEPARLFRDPGFQVDRETRSQPITSELSNVFEGSLVNPSTNHHDFRADCPTLARQLCTVKTCSGPTHVSANLQTNFLTSAVERSHASLDRSGGWDHAIGTDGQRWHLSGRLRWVPRRRGLDERVRPNYCLGAFGP